MDIILPDLINKHLKGLHGVQNKIGCSQASVYRYCSEDMVLYLKIEPKSGELEKEYQNLLWLEGRISVPKVLEWVSEAEYNYLLISEIAGRMLCDDYYLQRPKLAVSLLAEGLRLLWSVDIQACPIHNNLSRKLEVAAENVRNHRVDMSDWEPENDSFSAPEDLLRYLINNQPREEELVLTHGDYCLPNIFADGNRVTGFIDIGRAGIADQWQDVALCLRSFHHNFNTEEYDNLLLKELSIPLDQEKLDYYILLDELF